MSKQLIEDGAIFSDRIQSSFLSKIVIACGLIRKATSTHFKSSTQAFEEAVKLEKDWLRVSEGTKLESVITKRLHALLVDPQSNETIMLFGNEEVLLNDSETNLGLSLKMEEDTLEVHSDQNLELKSTYHSGQSILINGKNWILKVLPEPNQPEISLSVFEEKKDA